MSASSYGVDPHRQSHLPPAGKDGFPLPESYPATGQQKYPVPSQVGSGWIDVCTFDSGLMLGRMQCEFLRAYGQEYHDQPGKITVDFMLQGCFQTARAGERLCDVRAGEAFVRHVDDAPIRSCVCGAGAVAGLSLTLPQALAEALQDEGTELLAMASRQALAIATPTGQAGRMLCGLGQRLFGQPLPQTALCRLDMESLALGLLAQLLRLPAGGQNRRTSHVRWQRAIDTAIDILQAEWDQPHTIAGLARRAGINECYLKTLFRERTGQTVAGYLRLLRMEKARQMLASGRHSIKEAAFLAGYASSGKFAQAFRQVHGCLPSAFVPRTGVVAKGSSLPGL